MESEDKTDRSLKRILEENGDCKGNPPALQGKSRQKSSSLSKSIQEALDEYQVVQVPSDHKEPFLKHDTLPFMSFRNKDQYTEKEKAEAVFDGFKYWLEEQYETFLYTYEGPPRAGWKFPYFHKGLAKPEQEKQKEVDNKRKEEMEAFVKKRLILIGRLIKVYKTAKANINDEFLANLQKNDPLCEEKRKEGMNRITGMMVKQMALEYLYLKSQQLKKEIGEKEETLQRLKTEVDLDDEEYLSLENDLEEQNSVYSYTVRTAEKLRRLIELECGDEDKEEVMAQFEPKLLREMAKMYLTEIEKRVMTKEKKIVVEDEKKDEEGESAGESKEVDKEWIPEDWTEVIESYFKDKELYAKEDSDKGKLSLWKLGEGGWETGKQLGMGEGMEPVDIIPLRGEGGEGDEKKRVTLEVPPPPSASPLPSETTTEEEMICKSEADLLQDLKRELWLSNAFYFYTTKVIPQLAGAYKLIRSDRPPPPPDPFGSMGYVRLSQIPVPFTGSDYPALRSEDDALDLYYQKRLFYEMYKKEQGLERDGIGWLEGEGSPDWKYPWTDLYGEDISTVTSCHSASLGDIMKHFVEYLELSKEDVEEDLEKPFEDYGEGKEDLVEENWLESLKWKAPKGREPDPSAFEQCGQSYIEGIKRDLVVANSNYLKEHPEVMGIVVLLLRAFLIHQPEKNFEEFGKKTLLQRSFAKQLTKYLYVHHGGGENLKEPRHKECELFAERHRRLKCRIFAFEKSEEEYWDMWGVDWRKAIGESRAAHKVNVKVRPGKEGKGRFGDGPSPSSWVHLLLKETFQKKDCLAPVRNLEEDQDKGRRKEREATPPYSPPPSTFSTPNYQSATCSIR